MTVDGRGTRRGWTVHGHDACSKRRALTYLSWPTSATAIRLEWLSGARALARARTCTEPSRLANLAQHQIGPPILLMVAACAIARLTGLHVFSAGLCLVMRRLAVMMS